MLVSGHWLETVATDPRLQLTKLQQSLPVRLVIIMATSGFDDRTASVFSVLCAPPATDGRDAAEPCVLRLRVATFLAVRVATQYSMVGVRFISPARPSFPRHLADGRSKGANWTLELRFAHRRSGGELERELALCRRTDPNRFGVRTNHTTNNLPQSFSQHQTRQHRPKGHSSCHDWS